MYLINKINFFKDYFSKTWVEYFVNGTLNLYKVETIFRTNNSLENYNKIFKNLLNMKPDMHFTLYIDNIKQEIINHKIMVEELETKKPKKLSNNKILENIKESKMKYKENLEEINKVNLELKNPSLKI